MDRYPPHRILLTLLILFLLIGVFSRFAPDTPTLRIYIPTDSLLIAKNQDYPPRTGDPVIASDSVGDRKITGVGIEYPGGDTTVLNRFRSRFSTSHQDSATVLHFGDSQLEGDRITQFVRKGFVDGGFTRVKVINCTRRGAQSPGFGDQDTILTWLRKNQINPDLAILQYGLNMVRAGTSDYSFYRKMLIRQIEMLRRAYPALSVIMVGVSDMSYRRGGEIVPYSTVPAIRDAQRRAAAETGSAFWDLLQFMGGQGSGKAWFEQAEPLIRPDLCHFSAEGGAKVGLSLYQAIKSELYLHE